MVTTDVKMFFNFRRMRNIKRCNNFPTANPIDVAQHSYYVGMLTMAMVDEYNTYCDLNDCDFRPMNSEKALRKALLHDTDESITGDIHWNIKHHTPDTNKAISEATDDMMNSAYNGSETFELYHVLAHDCKDGAEGELVDMADMLELAIYSWEECSMGNAYMKPMLDKCIRLIQEKSMYSVLLETSPLFTTVFNMINSDDYSIVESLYTI